VAVAAEQPYPCPCCGYVVHEELAPGWWQICRICRWEDDPGQLAHPGYDGAANRPSLIEAQANYAATGVSDPERGPRATAPRQGDVRDPGWRPVEVEQDRLLSRPMDDRPWPLDRSAFYWWRPTYWRLDG
jgi:hypothetical protein